MSLQEYKEKKVIQNKILINHVDVVVVAAVDVYAVTIYTKEKDGFFCCCILKINVVVQFNGKCMINLGGRNKIKDESIENFSMEKLLQVSVVQKAYLIFQFITHAMLCAL